MGRPDQDLGKIHIPTLVANGENDRMVPTSNTVDLDRRLPNSETGHLPRRRPRRHLPVPQQFVPPLAFLRG
jgi:pimeloyl-ACP methyl ester carboxylesterase